MTENTETVRDYRVYLDNPVAIAGIAKPANFKPLIKGDVFDNNHVCCLVSTSRDNYWDAINERLENGAKMFDEAVTSPEKFNAMYVFEKIHNEILSMDEPDKEYLACTKAWIGDCHYHFFKDLDHDGKSLAEAMVLGLRWLRESAALDNEYAQNYIKDHNQFYALPSILKRLAFDNSIRRDFLKRPRELFNFYRAIREDMHRHPA